MVVHPPEDMTGNGEMSVKRRGGGMFDRKWGTRDNVQTSNLPIQTTCLVSYTRIKHICQWRR